MRSTRCECRKLTQILERLIEDGELPKTFRADCINPVFDFFVIIRHICELTLYNLHAQGAEAKRQIATLAKLPAPFLQLLPLVQGRMQTVSMKL